MTIDGTGIDWMLFLISLKQEQTSQREKKPEQNDMGNLEHCNQMEKA